MVALNRDRVVRPTLADLAHVHVSRLLAVPLDVLPGKMLCASSREWDVTRAPKVAACHMRKCLEPFGRNVRVCLSCSPSFSLSTFFGFRYLVSGFVAGEESIAIFCLRLRLHILRCLLLTWDINLSIFAVPQLCIEVFVDGIWTGEP